jgi:hypothetical protein
MAMAMAHPFQVPPSFYNPPPHCMPTGAIGGYGASTVNPFTGLGAYRWWWFGILRQGSNLGMIGRSRAHNVAIALPLVGHFINQDHDASEYARRPPVARPLSAVLPLRASAAPRHRRYGLAHHLLLKWDVRCAVLTLCPLAAPADCASRRRAGGPGGRESVRVSPAQRGDGARPARPLPALRQPRQSSVSRCTEPACAGGSP